MPCKSAQPSPVFVFMMLPHTATRLLCLAWPALLLLEQVSQVSAGAKDAIEKAGGSVTTVYYNQLGLRALLQPDWFAGKGRLLPRAARPPPKLQAQFDVVGELPPRTELPAAAAQQQQQQAAAA